MAEPPEPERPRWSITWLLRIQRTGRNRREPSAEPGEPGEMRRSAAFKWFAWSVILLLAVEVAVGVWLGVLPR